MPAVVVVLLLCLDLGCSFVVCVEATNMMEDEIDITWSAACHWRCCLCVWLCGCVCVCVCACV